MVGNGIPMGLQMAIKAFFPGFDPVELVNRVVEWQGDATRIVSNFDGRLKTLEMQNQTILRQQQLILDKISGVIDGGTR